ncbi:MAG: putative DNA binding domain-containing protein [Candidatus Riflebacteria bacterium]|nr:putative DNA binding domain-containing protein [Candidatus Riflebacteria bacterium]
METSELIEIISREEDGKNQFKANITNVDSLAAEIVAFCNTGGGRIFIGVNNDGSIAGLQRDDIGRLNQLLSNASSQSVRPPINYGTENVKLPDGIVMVVTIPDGLSKPYMDNSGAIWVKSGSDKRKVTSREEIQRMLQKSGLVHGDEIAANRISIASIDMDFFSSFYEKEYGISLDKSETNLTQLLHNMNLADGDVFNVAGALMFSQAPQFRLPAFIVKAVAFSGTDIEETKYVDSKDIAGRLSDVFQRSLAFLLTNTRSIQGEQGFNSVGDDEIPRIVFEELVANALIHRDYFITAPIRLLVFADRIEIISPGHLPNNLTIENIKNGNSNIRNPILASFASRMLPYRGLGSGIKRALREYKAIDFIDDRDGNKFTVLIKRRM